MKTLVLILHYNTLDLTNSLYESLEQFQSDDYDLFILNNGAEKDQDSEYPSLYTNENLYFGGGLNWAFKYMIEHTEYDSLLFLNSDLIIEGENFVKILRNEMFKNDLKIASFSLIENFVNTQTKTVYPQMGNWKSEEIRLVPWVDFQCPLIHRDLIEKIGGFSSKIKFGYAHHFICAFVCEENDWRIGVSDKKLVTHIGAQTATKIWSWTEYFKGATRQMRKYFEFYMNGKYKLKWKSLERQMRKYNFQKKENDQCKITFILSVVPYYICKDYEKYWKLLENTLVSVCGQTYENFDVIVVSNKTLNTFADNKKIKNVKFIEVNWESLETFHFPGIQRQRTNFDKGTKYTVAISEALKHSDDENHYVMFVDADDFVHRGIAEYIHHNNDTDVFRVVKGFKLKQNGMIKKTRTKGDGWKFSFRCGTSNVVKLNLLNQNPNFKKITKFIGDHVQTFGYFSRRSSKSKEIDFRAVIYNCSHDQQHDSFWLEKNTNIGRKYQNILKHPDIIRDFNLYDLYNNDE
jgi:GT2 family glycosyltransferase